MVAWTQHPTSRSWRPTPASGVRIGLVNRVAGAGGAYDDALALAAEIARRPTGSVRALKAKMIESTGLAGRVTLAL
jgi:hypothetical protein